MSKLSQIKYLMFIWFNQLIVVVFDGLYTNVSFIKFGIFET